MGWTWFCCQESGILIFCEINSTYQDLLKKIFVDFFVHQEPNGLFSADELSYESKLAENLNIGTKIMFQFRGLSIMFEAADVSDGKIQLKLVKDHGKQIIPKKNLERIKIIVNKKPVQNGN